MRSLLPKTLILFSSYSSSFSQARAHLFHLHLFHSSSSSSYPSSSYSYPYSRRHDEESRNVRVSVWWDFENCHLPSGLNLCKIAPSITEAVRANGIKGPVHITAFGNVMQLSKANQEALAYTGIHLTHIPNGGKNSADRSLLVDLMYWVSQNPPPAHLFLISGDKDFAGILHRLRMNNYNILLAIPGRAPDVLCSAATIMWQWSSLLKGEDLTGKHFNHPPDGPFGSWYGNYKVPLENPFSPVEQSTSSQTVEIYEPTSDSKPGFIPKSVLRQIRHILSSHPKGISISDFRRELEKCDVYLDKNLYGYKKFSRFLLSIPYIQLRPLGEGSFSVRLLSESPEPSESVVLPSPTSAVKNVERGYAATPKLNAENMARDAARTHSIASLHQRSMDADPKSFQQVPSPGKPIREYVDGKSSSPPLVDRHASQSPNELQNSSLGSEKVVGVADAQLSEIKLPPKELIKKEKKKLPPKDNEHPKTKTCSSEIRLKQSPDNDIVRSEDVSHKIPEKYTIAGNRADENHYITVENSRIANDESEKFKAEDKHEKPTRKEADEVCRSLSSLPGDDSVVDKEPVRCAKPYSKSPTFFSWIRSWWPFSKSSAKSDDLTGCENKMVSHSEDSKLSEPDETVSHSEEPKLSELDQTVSRSEEPMLSELDQTVSRSEEAKLSELNQTVSRSEEPKLSELDQTVSRSEEAKLSELNQTVSHSEEPKLSELDKTVSHSEEPKLSGLDQNVSHSGKSVLFSCDSFWRYMESFVFSPKGSLLFSQSRSREDVTHKLQKDGPLFLRSLTEEDILQLVDLLIAEKKWLEESPTQSFPFRLTQPVQKGSLMGQSNAANGLRSLFLSTTSQSSFQKSFEHDVEKQNQTTTHTGVSTPATESKYTERSRNDAIVDCQTLVKEILREHPEGYNIGSIRKLFLDRYGYNLDVQKLGYKKLTSLLQIMPGVKLESTYIFPSVPAVCASDEEAPILKTQVTNASRAVSNSDYELSDSAPKDVDSDSPWEELGPVSINNSNHSDLESKLSQKDKELYTSKRRDYEPIISDDDSSEEDDDSCLTQLEEQKPKCNEHDSSFWQALDLWHNSKEGGSSVKKLDNLDTLSNSLVDILNSTPQSTQGTLSKTPPGNFREKQRSQKTYSFVADPVLPNNKEKLIDGIFDGFKKAEESKMQN